jgi:hypothetical protein
MNEIPNFQNKNLVPGDNLPHGQEPELDRREIKTENEETIINDGDYRQSILNVFKYYNNGKDRINFIINSFAPYFDNNLIRKKEETKEKLLACAELNEENKFVNEIFEIIKPIIIFIKKNPEIEREFRDSTPEKVKREAFNILSGYEQIGTYISYGIDGKILHIHFPDAKELIKNKGVNFLINEIKNDFRNLAKVVDNNKQIEEITATSWMVNKLSTTLEKLGFFIINDDFKDKEERNVKHAVISRNVFLDKYL